VRHFPNVYISLDLFTRSVSCSLASAAILGGLDPPIAFLWVEFAASVVPYGCVDPL
jgi:hypothetical protein